MGLSLGSNFDDPQTQGILALGLGLLGSRGSFAQSLSQAGAGAMGVYQQQKDAQARRKTEDMQRQMAEMQLQQAQQQALKQKQIQDAIAESRMTPQQVAMKQNGGPTVAAAAATPNAAPGFDWNRYQGALTGIDPMAGLQLQQALQKDDTPVKLGADETLLGGKASGYKVLARGAPKEDDFIKNLRASGVQPGSPQWNKAIGDWITKQSTHQAPVSVTVSTEKDYAGKIAGGLADRDLAAIDSAKAAPAAIASSQRIRSIIASNQAITGIGADARLALAKVLNGAGLTKSDSVVATEDLQRELAGGLLTQIKSSGLGGGSGFSNADRDFLEKAAAGKINVNAQTLAKTAELAETVARKSIDAGNEAIRRIKGAKGIGTIPMGAEIEQPGSLAPSVVKLPQVNNPWNPPQASPAGGAKFLGFEN